jgi:hypothetical protein
MDMRRGSSLRCLGGHVPWSDREMIAIWGAASPSHPISEEPPSSGAEICSAALRHT